MWVFLQLFWVLTTITSVFTIGLVPYFWLSYNSIQTWEIITCVWTGRFNPRSSTTMLVRIVWSSNAANIFIPNTRANLLISTCLAICRLNIVYTYQHNTNNISQTNNLKERWVSVVNFKYWALAIKSTSLSWLF